MSKPMPTCYLVRKADQTQVVVNFEKICWVEPMLPKGCIIHFAADDVGLSVIDDYDAFVGAMTGDRLDRD